MSNIIYTSNNVIPWDTQSAFKISTYHTLLEERMIYTYMKLYVQNGDLKLCTFCFNQNPKGCKDLQLSLNLNPLNIEDFLHIEYGVEGFNEIKLLSNSGNDVELNQFEYSCFRGDDEQGYYWAFEISIPKEFIEKYFNTILLEKSIISLNLHQIYDGSNDFSCLFESGANNLQAKKESLSEFIILNY